MALLMRIVGTHQGRSSFDGLYLAEYDPGRSGTDPNTGEYMLAHVVCTGDPKKAMKFKDAGEVHATWTKVDPRRPTRGDGRPNRPLTAFTFEMLDESKAPEIRVGKWG